MSISKEYKYIKRFVGHLLIGRNPFDLAFFYCKGIGLEVGARNNPYRFNRNTKVFYADIADETNVENILKTGFKIAPRLKLGRFAKVNFILRGPQYGLEDITPDSLDFVYSDNVIEHTPNPIFAITEQLRVVKSKGVVYGVLPNKNFTFDARRSATQFSVLRKKYLNNIFNYELDEALDIVLNTINFPHKFKTQEEQLKFAQNMIDENNGVYHFHVFDEVNTLEMITYIAETKNSVVEYFSAPEGKHIHFAIRKN